MTPKEQRIVNRVASGCLRGIATYLATFTFGYFYGNQRGILVMLCVDMAHAALSASLSKYTLERDVDGTPIGHTGLGKALHAICFVVAVAAAILATVWGKR